MANPVKKGLGGGFLALVRDEAGFIVLLLGFAAAVVCVTPEIVHSLIAAIRSPTAADWEHAVRDSADRSPQSVRDLAQVDLTKQPVFIRVGAPVPVDPTTHKLTKSIWVSLREELYKACAGKTVPRRAIEYVLGIPPSDWPMGIYEVQVDPSAGIFRPCASTDDLAAKSCSLDQIDLGDSPLEKTNKHLLFVLKQNWNTHQIGDPSLGNADKYSGYPFTGMGWTYDWDPASTTHVGVSEFVVEKDSALVSLGPAMTPEAFCKPTGS